ncbi:MAG: rRNA maturation RNase YbeY [Hyphomicrobiaceae bacterium]
MHIELVVPEESPSIERMLAHDMSQATDDVVSALTQCVDLGPGREVTLVLSTDAEVRELNLQWRGLDKPTNVLSFPSLRRPTTAGPGDHFLGDIILAAETVIREATEMNCPVGHHLRHLILHGLLHLLGHDHEDEAEAAEMEGLETRVLGLLDIPDPYADRLLTPSA